MAAAPEAAGAAADAKGGGDEVDVVRAVLYFFAVLLVGLGVVHWVLLARRDAYREAVAYGEKNLPKMVAAYDGVAGLLKEYERSGMDAARKNTLSWLKDRYTAAGIQDGQVTTGAWTSRPSKDHIENSVEVVVKGVNRKNAVQFLWNVERVSPKMRTIEMKLTRTVPANQPRETDLWELRATFGYRVPKGMKESGS